MYFGKNILKYKKDILKDLKTLISFQSISGENQGDCEQALNFILDKLRNLVLTLRILKILQVMHSLATVVTYVVYLLTLMLYPVVTTGTHCHLN